VIIVRRTFDTTGIEVVKDNVVLPLSHDEFHEVVSKGFTLFMATGMLQAVDQANQPKPEAPKGIRDADGNFG
jgi:hypothetical protein